MRHFRPPASSSRDPRFGKAREALLVLAAVAAEDADYAHNRNGRGFSKADSAKGHAMASLSVTAVLSSSATFEAVTRLAARYRRQASKIAQGSFL